MYYRLPLAGLALSVIVGCAQGPAEPPIASDAQYAFQLISRTTTPGWARDVWVVGDTAYVADDEQGITIWNISNLSRPVLFDTVRTGGPAFAVAYAPLMGVLITQESGSSGGVNLYDRLNEDSLLKKKNVARLGSTNGSDFRFRELSRDSLFVAEVEDDNDGYQSMMFFTNRTDTIWPWRQENGPIYHPPLGTLRGLLPDSLFIYLAHGQFGLSILQQDTVRWRTSSPTLVGNIDTPGMARDLALNRSKRHLFVADHQSGLQIVDVTDKSQPLIVGSLRPAGVNEALKVRALGDTAIFIDKYNGLFAVDASRPDKPRLVGIYDTPNPQGLFVRESDRTIFLADLELGLLVLRFR